MLGRLLKAHGTDHGSAVAIAHAQQDTNYSELLSIADSYARAYRPRPDSRIGVAIASPSRFVGALAAIDSAGANAFLLGEDFETNDTLAETLGLDAIWHDDLPDAGPATEPPEGEATGKVTLLTSGTTGTPKAIEHTWETLARPVRRDPAQRNARWLCAYPLRLYAGTQVLLQALINGAAIVVPTRREPTAIAKLIAEAGVTHASGTPTFWRQLCLFGDRKALAESRVEQITLGGESVSQDLLDMLRSLLPAARVVHIYASTELGRLFSVTDGRAGFPRAYLDELPGGGVELSIRDGELYARSANAMVGCSDWLATGDHVEVDGDRVLFRGRKTEIINVGGFKVSPIKVETTLRQVDGVADLRIYAKRSSLAGQLVACDVLVEEGRDPAAVRTALMDTARSILSPPETPRIVRIVDRIESTAAFKVARGETDA